MSRLVFVLMFLLIACSIVFGQDAPTSVDSEWRNYGRDPGGMRFSPLNQINPSNVELLQRAWTYQSPPTPNSGISAFESTPLMVDDVLYFTTARGQVIALDAETGEQRWLFDPHPEESGTSNT